MGYSLEARGALWVLVGRSGAAWDAFLEASGTLLEACGALWKIVERPRGSWSALLEAQACGALRWRLLERAESSWSALEAMVMEARLRPPLAGPPKWSQIDTLSYTVMY